MGDIFKEVTAQNFDDEVITSNAPVVVDFWGPKCEYCLNLMPHIEELAKQYADKAKFVKLDASKNRRFCISLKVLGLPTFIFFKQGVEVDRMSGNDLTIEDIEASLQKLIAS